MQRGQKPNKETIAPYYPSDLWSDLRGRGRRPEARALVGLASGAVDSVQP